MFKYKILVFTHQCFSQTLGKVKFPSVLASEPSCLTVSEKYFKIVSVINQNCHNQQQQLNPIRIRFSWKNYDGLPANLFLYAIPILENVLASHILKLNDPSVYLLQEASLTIKTLPSNFWKNYSSLLSKQKVQDFVSTKIKLFPRLLLIR